MGAAIAMRADFTADELRALATASRDARQTRRRPAVAAICDGGARSETARIGGVGLQIVRSESDLETVWQVMRGAWLSNRIVRSYDDIVDHCRDAWNTLVDQPWRIMTIGRREWAHEF